MLLKQTKEGIEYIRQHWYEWFVVDVLVKYADEGVKIPRFYLPVTREIRSNTLVCWIFPLAPLALLANIIRRSFWGIWSDLYEFSEILKYKLNRHVRKNRGDSEDNDRQVRGDSD